MPQPPFEMADRDRASFYRANRLREAREEKERAVACALCVPPEQRTAEEWATIAYSPLPGGTGQRCGC